jgi:hemolysin III
LVLNLNSDKAPPVDRVLSIGEEVANSVTHGLGLIAALIFLPVLLVRAQVSSGPYALTSAVVFSSTLVLVYASSTIYHALPISTGKRLFRVLDHSAIYLLIAGTYTPFALGPLRGVWGWSLLAVIWVLALVGITSKLITGVKIRHASTALYLVMGWLIVVALKPLIHNVPLHGLLWIAAGGIAYTAGVAFYAMTHVRYAHTVWHLFVAAGSACHFIAVLLYAIPA